MKSFSYTLESPHMERTKYSMYFGSGVLEAFCLFTIYKHTQTRTQITNALLHMVYLYITEWHFRVFIFCKLSFFSVI